MHHKNRFLQGMFSLLTFLAFVLSPCLGTTGAQMSAPLPDHQVRIPDGTPKADTFCGVYMVLESVTEANIKRLKLYTYDEEAYVQGVSDVTLEGVTMKVTYFAGTGETQIDCA